MPPITRAGLLAWVLVGLPTLTSAFSSPRLGAWLAAWLTFGAAFAVVSRRPHLDRIAAAGLLLEASSVVTMVALLCNGFEGMLLVVVAAQLGRAAATRTGVLVVALQTVATGTAVALHWTPQAALMLVPPYLGFQLFSLLGFQHLRREAKERDAKSRLEERLLIARELHDALGHYLTALSINLEVASHQTEGAARENIRLAQSLARLLLGDVREFAHAMKGEPPSDLPGGLRRLAGEVLAPRIHVEAPDLAGIGDRRRAHALLRCAQEFVTNSIRHGGARNVWLELKRDGDRLELAARDDGRGAAELRDGGGISGMRQRMEELGGTLAVEHGGEGFAMRARLPLAGTA